MRHAIRAVLVAALLTYGGASAWAAGSAPVAKNVSATSLYRADHDWTVTTSITLEVEDQDSGAWTFKLVHPEQLIESADGKERRLSCTDVMGAAVNVFDRPKAMPVEMATPVTIQRIFCRYNPKVDSDDTETFTYVVVDGDGNESQPATVTVDIQRSGLRWEVITNGALQKSSDFTSGGGIPDVFGAAGQDILFRLDWLVANPGTTSPAPAAPARVRRVGTDVGWSRSLHVLFETGIVGRNEAATAKPVAQIPDTPGGAVTALTNQSAEPTVATERKLTFGGEIGFNRTYAPGGGSTYIEVGAVGRGGADMALGDASSLNEVGNKVVSLVRQQSGPATYRAEFTFRARLKQYRDDTLRTSVTHDNRTTYPKNGDDFVIVEGGVQYDSALAGLETLNIEKHGLVGRVLFSPELPLPAHPRVALGFEVTRSFATGSPLQFKVIYGGALGALGLH